MGSLPPPQMLLQNPIMIHLEIERLRKQLSEEVEDLKHDKRSFRASNDRLNQDLEKMTEELVASRKEQEHLRNLLENERSENVALRRLVLESQAVEGPASMTLGHSLQLEVKTPKQLAAKSGSTKAKTLHPPTHAILNLKRARPTAPSEAPTMVSVHEPTPRIKSEEHPWMVLVEQREEEGRQPKRLKVGQSASPPETASASSSKTPETILPMNQNLPSPLIQLPQRKYKESQAFLLSPTDVRSYLGDHLPTAASPLPTPLKVARGSMIQCYGGSLSQTFQNIPNPVSDHATHGTHRKAFYPNFELNPCVPTACGTSGLLLGKAELGEGTWSIFSKTAQKSFSEWTYIGEYEAKVSGSMTKEQFCSQKESVQQIWVEHVSARKYDCHLEAKARIHARKIGWYGVESDAGWQAKIKETEQDLKTGKLNPPTAQEIKQSYEKGHVSVPVTRLNYLGYDDAFAERIRLKVKEHEQRAVAKKHQEDATTRALQTVDTSARVAVPLLMFAVRGSRPKQTARKSTSRKPPARQA